MISAIAEKPVNPVSYLRAIARRHIGRGYLLEPDDFEQELWLRLFRNNIDWSKVGVKQYIKRVKSTTIKRAEKWKMSIEDIRNPEFVDKETPAIITQVRLDARHFLNKLSLFDRKIVWRHIKKKQAFRTIARRYGVTPPAVQYRYKKALKTLRRKP